MADAEMNKGVQILLERMSSNPDEFIPDVIGNYPSKWRNIIREVEYRFRSRGLKPKAEEMVVIPLPFLSDKEIDALWQKLQQLQGDLFTKQVMNTLLSDSSSYRELSPSLFANSLSVTASTSNSTVTISPNGTTLGRLQYP